MISHYSLSRTTLAISVSLVLGTGVSGMASADITRTPDRGAMNFIEGKTLPTGKRITPEAAPRSIFQPLNPGLPTLPAFLADHAVDTAISPDGKTLLILTSGYIVSLIMIYTRLWLN